MKITNHSNVPDCVMKYLTLDQYDGYTDDKYTISATTLLKPIQEILLTRYYYEQIEVDAMDLIWKVSGTRMHIELDKVEDQPIVRMTAPLGDAWKITGKFDHVEDNTLWDYKETACGTFIWKSRDEDYMMQLSIYRWLYKQVYGVVLRNEGKILSKYRDWRKSESKSGFYGRYKLKDGESYPKPLEVLTYKLLPLDEVENWLRERTTVIGASMNDGYVPLCTDKERWFNVKTGVYNKCAEYCDARAFCTQNRPELTVIDGGVA